MPGVLEVQRGRRVLAVLGARRVRQEGWVSGVGEVLGVQGLGGLLGAWGAL